MDENLDLRYRRLLEDYDTDDWHTPSYLFYFDRILRRRLGRQATPGRNPLFYVQERLIKEVQIGNLRPDAALCLLALYDHMIFRPYAGFVPDGLPIHGLAADFIHFTETVQVSLSVILGELRQSRLELKYEEPRSSHDVLRAIDGVWGKLSEFFRWG